METYNGVITRPVTPIGRRLTRTWRGVIIGQKTVTIETVRYVGSPRQRPQEAPWTKNRSE